MGDRWVGSLPELSLLTHGKKTALAFASAGNGTTPHLTGENLFKLRAKVDITHIPFKGGGPAAAAVLGGQPAIRR